MDRVYKTPFALVLLLILGIECIIAFLGNGFIMAVNGYRWIQSKKVLTSDLLLTALGATRFLLQLVVMMEELLYVCFSEFVCDYYFLKSFFCAWTYFSSASIWCATWLSVFYCVKITNFYHSYFLWLKLRIDVFITRLLGLSLTVFSLPFLASALRINIYCDWTGNMTGNASQGEGSSYYQPGNFFSLHFTFIAINISICLTASILLLISLWRHTRNLKRSGISTKDFSTQAHINVVKSMLSFLFFYLLYVAVLTISLNYSSSLSIIEGLVADVAMALCPSAHSITLIITNPKLKEVCIRSLKIRRRTS